MPSYSSLPWPGTISGGKRCWCWPLCSPSAATSLSLGCSAFSSLCGPASSSAERNIMDLFSNLAIGFGVAFTPINLLYSFIGVMLGTMIGVLPGIGPLATIAMLLPATYALPPVSALIMLAGIYYGSQYGGSTTAILVNLPGESSSVVTVIDGHQMAKRGRAGPALAAAGLGSFFAGCVGTLILAGFA